MICCLLTLSLIIVALIILLAAMPIILIVLVAQAASGLYAHTTRAITGGTDTLSDDQALALEYPYCRLFKTHDQLMEAFNNVKAYEYKLVTTPYKILNMPDLPPDMLAFSALTTAQHGPQPTLIELAPEDYHTMNWMSDWFNEKCRLACKRYDEESSPLEYWAANKQDIVLTLKKQHSPLTYQALHDETYRRTMGCNNFRPGLLKGAIEYFKARSVLDPSAGWGDRLIGALAAGIRYVGVDPNPCVHEGYAEIIKTFGVVDDDTDHKSPPPTLIVAPFQDCELPASETFDMVFTSPPYFDLEVYSDDKTQSTNEFQQLDAWFEGFLIKSLSKAWEVLNATGHMIIVINNIRDGPDFVMRMIERVNQFPGAQSLGVLSYAEKRPSRGQDNKNASGLPSRTHYKSPQPMWIWRKDVSGNHQRSSMRQQQRGSSYLFYDRDEQYVMTLENFKSTFPRVFDFNNMTPCEIRSAWKDLRKGDRVHAMGPTTGPATNSPHSAPTSPPDDPQNSAPLTGPSVIHTFPDSRYYGRLSDGQEVWQKSPIVINPPLVLSQHEGFVVVRDDLLPGGTKQRAMAIIKDYPEQELVYAGPWNGYAQVALSMGGKLYGKRVTLFMTRDDYATNIRAKTYGAHFIVHPKATLADLQRAAKEYVEEAAESATQATESPHTRRLMEFGFDSPEFRQELAARIIEAADKSESQDVPLTADARASFKGTVWLVAGSGTLLNVLYGVFPSAHFGVVQVGKTIWPDQTDESRTTIYKAPEGFYDEAQQQPPYPSASRYDAKLWQFARTHGESGDIIWNVAA